MRLANEIIGIPFGARYLASESAERLALNIDDDSSSFYNIFVSI